MTHWDVVILLQFLQFLGIMAMLTFMWRDIQERTDRR